MAHGKDQEIVSELIPFADKLSKLDKEKRRLKPD